MDDLTGQNIGQYRVIEKLGAGGMAEVYKAYQPRLDRYVAIKFIRPELALDDNFRARFEQEARAIARLSHGNIVHVYDFGEEERRYYLVMEYIEGRTLKELIRAKRAAGEDISIAETAELVGQVAAALDYAHGQGIIHRDVKPDNVMLTPKGRAVLNDFGIARIIAGDNGLTQTGMAMGTPDYMAPEQIQGGANKAGPASDIYSLGIIVYEMVTGQTPFQADTPFAVMLKHVNDPIPLPHRIKPSLPPMLERVLLKALAKDPADRYAQAGEFAGRLTEAVDAVAVSDDTLVTPATDDATMMMAAEAATAAAPVEATAVSPAAETAVSATPDTVAAVPSPQPARGRRWLWAGAGIVGLLLVALAAVWLLRPGLPLPAAGGGGHITYTGEDGRLYRIAIRPEAAPEDLSARLDAALEPGEDSGIAISRDGEWLLFATTRQDAECAGWACLAIASSDLGRGEIVYLEDGRVVHPEGLAAIAPGGEQIVYTSAEGPNEFDLYAIERVNGELWSAPLLLTADSDYDYNDVPTFSADGDLILFSCGDAPYGGGWTAVCEVDIDGDGFGMLIGPDDMPQEVDADALTNPRYVQDDAILFQVDFDGMLWRYDPDEEALSPVIASRGFEGVFECILPGERVVTLVWDEALEGPQLVVFDLQERSRMVLETETAVQYGVSCGL